MEKFYLLFLLVLAACNSPEVQQVNKSLATAGDLVETVVAESTKEKANPESIIAEGAKLNLVSDQFKFTEGPAVDKDGNVFFTDQPNDKIWKWSTDGSLKVYMEKSGRSNGLYVDDSGNLLACADEKFELWRIHPDGKIDNMAGGFGGKKFNGPNDLWVDQKDGIYFTDPYYQRPYWTRKEKDMEGEDVYYFNPSSRIFQRVSDDLVQPNGIVGTADGKQLYVADIGANKTYVYDIAGPGKLTNKRLFCELGSDGMTIDNFGNVYLTGKGVTVFNKDGKQIEQIVVDQDWTANVVFGGKKQDLLFITASTAVYTLKMNVHGVR